MASDVYALGVILYETLTGRLPFTNSDPTELARMHREDIPQEPNKINSSIPDELNQIVMKVLSKEPSARYRTADQLARILRAFLEKQNAAHSEHLPEKKNTLPYGNGNKMHNGKHSHPVPTPLAQPIQQKAPVLEQQVQEKRNSIPKKRIEMKKPVLTNTDTIEDYSTPIDWITVLLGFFALLLTTGLIPFWLWIWYRIKPIF
jgi:serine/threonine-protein kinase